MGHKRALIVGINYVGTGNDLRGCINDANNIKDLITTHYGFQDVKMLLEQDATTQNIKDGLRWLVSGCLPGDVLFFHYSGHGSQIRDTTNDEPDGLDEIICPIDLDWREKVITDDYMKWVFDVLPVGVNLTVLLDSCNSGTGLDQTNQYQPLGSSQPSITKDGRYLTPPPEVLDLIQAEPLDFKPRSLQSREINTTGLLISGCQSNQTSADAYIGGKWQGAATYSLLTTLQQNKYDVDYQTLVEGMNQFMFDKGYTQRPELNGSAALFTEKFLASPAVSEDQVNAYEPPDLTPAPETTQTPEETLQAVESAQSKKVFIKVAIALIAIAALIAFFG